jgi:2,4-dienoyl-CoA reductase-like NADH-dependent reductase (Old Yellow Enzyme family)
MANVARLLLSCHDNAAVFDFCGGMLFQLVLTEKLRSHLAAVAEGGAGAQPVIFDAAKTRMSNIPGYSRSSEADNVRLFHGREVRKAANAAGGMRLVLQLSHAGEDPEGWSREERAEYDGWGHDVSRTWRKGERLEAEGVEGFRKAFGPEAYTLHHRFYLHSEIGSAGGLWLAAEDGCEGRLITK